MLWKALWPDEEVVDLLNRFRGFFGPVPQALHEMMSMGKYGIDRSLGEADPIEHGVVRFDG